MQILALCLQEFFGLPSPQLVPSLQRVISLDIKDGRQGQCPSPPPQTKITQIKVCCMFGSVF